MAESHYIADSAHDPHPLLMKDAGRTWPRGPLPVSMASGLAQRGSSIIVTASFRS
ncbi:MAG TPA: hypothetical protein VIQ29_25055 [Ancylobacter sp.]